MDTARAFAPRRGSVRHGGAGRRVLLAVAALASAVAVRATPDDAPPCVPPGSKICAVMASDRFLATYRQARGEAVLADDVVDLLTNALHDAVVGRSPQAGPGAVGKQVEAALDQWLFRVQRICRDPRARELAPRTIAEQLDEAGRTLGTTLAPADLGSMTGTVMALVEARGVPCLCAARRLSDLPSTCSSPSSR